MDAFLTGSQVYGTPMPESDVDLVVPMSSGEMAALAAMSEGHFSFDEYGCGLSIRFGKLNVIALCGDRLVQLWKDSTEICKARKPVSKEAAKAIFQLREIEAKERVSA